MPQLPSGRHFALDFQPLLEALRAAESGHHIPRVMEIQTLRDLHPYIRLLWLLPISADSDHPLNLHKDSTIPPPGLTPIPTGHTAAQMDQLADEVSAEDLIAIQDFLQSETIQKNIHNALAAVIDMQNFLLDHPQLRIRVQAGWSKLGVHPLQTGESEDSFWQGAFNNPHDIPSSLDNPDPQDKPPA